VKFGLVQSVIRTNIVIGCSDSDLDQPSFSVKIEQSDVDSSTA